MRSMGHITPHTGVMHIVLALGHRGTPRGLRCIAGDDQRRQLPRERRLLHQVSSSRRRAATAARRCRAGCREDVVLAGVSALRPV